MAGGSLEGLLPVSQNKMEVDLSRLPAAVQRKMDEIFRGDADLKILKAIQRQTHTAAAARNNPHRWKDDFGERTLVVDPVIDSYWTAQYGPDWKANKDLVRFLLGRNPEIAGQSRSGKIISALTKFGGCTKRFSKKYEFKAA